MEHAICIVCSNKQLKPLNSYKRAFLVKCAGCGMVFSQKIPSNEELTKIYTNYPRFTSLPPLTVKRYNELLDKMEPFRRTNNLLDLGCSNGLFLECAKQRGWNVFGTEYAQESIDYCADRNIKVFKSDQMPDDFFKLSFDVVTSFEVIEHINNPNEDMALVNKVLRKGGAFYFTTPNFNSISRIILKEKWNVIDYPEHLSYYTPSSIHFLLNANGYKKNFLITTGISFTRFSQSMNSEAVSKSIPVNDEALRNKIEHNPFLMFAKSTINFILNLFKVGDSLKGFYIKQ